MAALSLLLLMSCLPGHPSPLNVALFDPTVPPAHSSSQGGLTETPHSTGSPGGQSSSPTCSMLLLAPTAFAWNSLRVCMYGVTTLQFTHHLSLLLSTMRYFLLVILCLKFFRWIQSVSLPLDCTEGSGHEGHVPLSRSTWHVCCYRGVYPACHASTWRR